jgi:hypothetical protein
VYLTRISLGAYAPVPAVAVAVVVVLAVRFEDLARLEDVARLEDGAMMTVASASASAAQALASRHSRRAAVAGRGRWGAGGGIELGVIMIRRGRRGAVYCRRAPDRVEGPLEGAL